MESRLKRNQEKQALLNIVLIFIGTLVLIGVLIVFGMPLLINFSLTIERFNKSNQSPTNNNNVYIEPPTLNPTFSATNSATVTISGYSSPSQSVDLYVNNKLVDKTGVKNDRSFSFNGIILEDGKNEIKAKTDTNNNVGSDYSNTISIIYTNKQPSLNIDSPQDNQSFSKDNNTISVSGATDPGDKVTVNGFWAIVNDQGKFSYSIKLQNGDNSIKIIASDDAGNHTEKDIKVSYSQ